MFCDCFYPPRKCCRYLSILPQITAIYLKRLKRNATQIKKIRRVIEITVLFVYNVYNYYFMTLF